MMGRMTLREVREALAAAKAKKGTKASPATPTVQELESLARLLEREANADAEPGAAANNAGHGGSRRRSRPRGRR